jgi:hypothetical protein
MIDYLPLVLTGIGLTASIVYYASILRNANKTRRAQIAMSFYSHVTKKEFWGQWTRVLFQYNFTTLQEWDENYGPLVNTDAATEVYTVVQMFVGAGAMLKEGVIDAETLFQYLPQLTIRVSYDKFRPWIEGLRERYNDPEFAKMFDYLLEEANRLYPNIGNPRRVGTSEPTLLFPDT